jgi:hypothetical protein
VSGPQLSYFAEHEPRSCGRLETSMGSLFRCVADATEQRMDLHLCERHAHEWDVMAFAMSDLGASWVVRR